MASGDLFSGTTLHTALSVRTKKEEDQVSRQEAVVAWTTGVARQVEGDRFQTCVEMEPGRSVDGFPVGYERNTGVRHDLQVRRIKLSFTEMQRLTSACKCPRKVGQ